MSSSIARTFHPRPHPTGPRPYLRALVLHLMVPLGLTLGVLSSHAPTATSAEPPEVRLEIRTSQAISIRVYVAGFGTLGAGGLGRYSADFEKIVESDLRFSGFFEVARAPAGDLNAFLDSFKTKVGSKEEVLVEGRVSAEDDKIVFEGRLYDIASRKTIMNKRYKFVERALRKAAHRFSDEIVLQLTGERGIASTSVAFVSNASGAKEVHVMDYDGYGGKQITMEKSICLSPHWSPDGQRVVYTSYSSGNPDLHVVGRYGGKPYTLSAYRGLNSSPAWAPDGKKIALTLTKDGNAEIYVMNTDGSGLRRLTSHPAIDSSPSWSPSGRQIAFTSDRSGSPQVYLMEADGSNVRRLTFAGSYNDSPAWSPKGDRIVYASRMGNNFEVFVVDIAGVSPIQLTSGKGNNENPNWSPDGRQIVFSSTRDGKRDIYLMSADGSNARRLTTRGENFNPSWSPRTGEE
ncbi:MAG: Tol-Pal system beta propeller repeat protein TolB [Candidatus Eisenbacteria bacterium]|nr:Tol-Pal system beta propeller repeat protein TolB [Candidatus Eisenbacteria bacterium]